MSNEILILILFLCGLELLAGKVGYQAGVLILLCVMVILALF
jgi:hypothetical protein